MKYIVSLEGKVLNQDEKVLLKSKLISGVTLYGTNIKSFETTKKTFDESKTAFMVDEMEGILATYNPYEQGTLIFIGVMDEKLYKFTLVNTGETGHFPSEEHQAVFREILSSVEIK